MAKRCVNIDWLEVYALEPISQPHNADYFVQLGWWVERREYGTRVYAEMFTLKDEYGYKVIEVRRAPMSSGGDGILPPNACHIRLTNRACYFKDAAAYMARFLQQYSYTFQRISRVDVCLDFERFDRGDMPQRFLQRYVEGKYSKINQAEVRAHGADTWERRQWTSLAWGSKKSAISTKFYCKTKELQEVKDKPYIRWAWFCAGLVDDPVKMVKRSEQGEYSPVIWRVEFSIKSDVKNWFTYEKNGNQREKRSMRNTLDMYDTTEKLLVMFDSLQRHYFHFKKFTEGRTKYECPDKILFDFGTTEITYKPQHTASDKPKATDEERLLKYLKRYDLLHPTESTHAHALAIIQALETNNERRLLQNPYDSVLLAAMQKCIALKMRGDERDPADIIELLCKKIKEGSIF